MKIEKKKLAGTLGALGLSVSLLTGCEDVSSNPATDEKEKKEGGNRNSVAPVVAPGNGGTTTDRVKSGNSNSNRSSGIGSGRSTGAGS